MKVANQLYEDCISACRQCAIVCRTCADACLREDDVKAMAECIRLNMDCASVCDTAARLMVSDSEFAQTFCGICADICHRCEKDCGSHHMQHCQESAKMCKHCAMLCSEMVVAA